MSVSRGIDLNQVRYVKAVTAGTILYYKWKTKDFASITPLAGAGVTAAEFTTLGHETTLPTNGIVLYRASAPRPPRVKKFFQYATTAAEQSTVTTFCAKDKLSDAQAANWTIVKFAKLGSARAGLKTVTGLAKMSNGAVYGWPQNKADNDAFKSALKLEEASTYASLTERSKLIIGAEAPRPRRAKKVVSQNPTTKKPAFAYSFASHDADLGADGWEEVEPEFIITA